MIGQTVATDGPNDHTLSQQSLVYFHGIALHINSNEVARRGNPTEIQATKTLLKTGHPLLIDLNGAADVRVILQRRHGTRLSRQIQVKRLPQAIEHVANHRTGHRVPDPRPGQAIGFGKRSGNHQVGVVPQQGNAIGQITAQTVLKIGLVQNDQYRWRNAIHKSQ